MPALGWGPSAPKARPRLKTRPRRTQPAARFTSSGVIRLRVPRSSSPPQRPQLQTRLAISRNCVSDNGAPCRVGYSMPRPAFRFLETRLRRGRGRRVSRDDSGFAQPGDLLGREPEQVAQDGFTVLPEVRARRAQGPGSAGEADSRALEPEL